MKIEKNIYFWGGGGRAGGSGWGGGQVRRVRLDVNEELKFLRKFTKKKNFLGGGGSGVHRCLGWGGGQGGCEGRIEVFVKI